MRRNTDRRLTSAAKEKLGNESVDLDQHIQQFCNETISLPGYLVPAPDDLLTGSQLGIEASTRKNGKEEGRNGGF